MGKSRWRTFIDAPCWDAPLSYNSKLRTIVWYPNGRWSLTDMYFARQKSACANDNLRAFHRFPALCSSDSVPSPLYHNDHAKSSDLAGRLVLEILNARYCWPVGGQRRFQRGFLGWGVWTTPVACTFCIVFCQFALEVPVLMNSQNQVCDEVI